jgi:toxin ParE1/3/4
MANYRISEDAKGDLQRIYRRGVLEFGEAQADQYFDAFFKRFAELAEHPSRYPAVNSICGSDNIYYRVVGGVVEIMRILGQQDVNEWL